MRNLRVSVFAERVRQHRGVLVLLQSHSETMLRSGGKKRCIKMNYYVAIYSVPRVLHACYSVRDVSDAESRGPRSEVRRASVSIPA